MSTSVINTNYLYKHPKCKYTEGGALLDSGWFKRNILMEIQDVEHHRKNFNNKDVFITAYQYETNDPSLYKASNKYGALYLDFDNGDINLENHTNEENEKYFNTVRADAILAVNFFRSVYGIRHSDLDIFFSGSKGVHITIHPKIIDLKENIHLNRIFKSIILKIPSKYNTLDTSIYDVVRLWRLPNSINGKTGLYKIPLNFKELESLSFKELVVLAKTERNLPIKHYKTNNRAKRVFQKHSNDFSKNLNGSKKTKYMGERKKIEVTPPCVLALLMSSVPKGQRNNTAIALASVFYQQGFTIEETKKSITDWSNHSCDPPLDETEIEALVNSQYNHEYLFGCEKMKEISVCDLKNCPLMSRHRRVVIR